MAKRLISCCLNVGIWLRRGVFKKAIATNGVPEKVVIDKSGVNLAGLQAVNTI